MGGRARAGGAVRHAVVANIYEAVADVSFANGAAATPLWQRIPEQILYIAVVLWVARTADSTPVRRALGATRKTAKTRKTTELV